MCFPFIKFRGVQYIFTPYHELEDTVLMVNCIRRPIPPNFTLKQTNNHSLTIDNTEVVCFLAQCMEESKHPTRERERDVVLSSTFSLRVIVLAIVLGIVLHSGTRRDVITRPTVL